MSDPRVVSIRRRWEQDRKVAAVDVEYLLGQAERLDTLLAAEQLRRNTDPVARHIFDVQGFGPVVGRGFGL